MRRDDVLLIDMQQACARIAEYIAGLTRRQFLEDTRTQDAVELQILILGEAASRISQAFRDSHPDFPWRRLRELRNFYIHAYERIDAEGVWNTARGLVRRVAEAVAQLIPAEETASETESPS